MSFRFQIIFTLRTNLNLAVHRYISLLLLYVHIKTVYEVPEASNHHIKLIRRSHYYRNFQLSSLMYSRPRFRKKESPIRYEQKSNETTVCSDVVNRFICVLLQGE